MAVTKSANPIVSNPVQAATEALASGKDVSAAVYGTPSTPTVDTSKRQGPVEAAPSQEGEFNPSEFMEGGEAEGTGQADGQGQPNPSTLDELTGNSQNAEKSATQKALEEIIITDESGRRKITVDWNDKAKLRKYVEMAAGMRKFQAERDRQAARLKDLQPKYKELADSWKAVEDAYSKDGVAGLVNLLSGKDDGYQQYIQQEYSKIKRREEATPSELAQIELEDKLQAQVREKERLQKAMDEHLKQVSQKEEAASMRALESQVHPAFDKYRFAGKLGDPAVEHRLDQAIWSQALQNLEQYPDTVEITSALIDKEFRTVANTFRKVISGQARQQVKQIVKQKKVEAQQKVAGKVMSGMRSNSATDKFKSDIRKGDLVSAMTDFMTGRFKF